MYDDHVRLPLRAAGCDNKIPSVKLLETVTGPSGAGLVAMDGYGMGLMERSDEQSNRRDANRGRAVVFQRPSQAQSQAPSSGNGVSNFLGNIFSGPKSAPAPQAAPGPDGGRARPGAARTAPPATR